MREEVTEGDLMGSCLERILRVRERSSNETYLE